MIDTNPMIVNNADQLNNSAGMGLIAAGPESIFAAPNRTGCLALRFDLGSEGLGYYFPVPHNKCVGSEFV